MEFSDKVCFGSYLVALYPVIQVATVGNWAPVRFGDITKMMIVPTESSVVGWCLRDHAEWCDPRTVGRPNRSSLEHMDCILFCYIFFFSA